MESRNLKSGKLVFISHDASLTGAPILLLNLLRLLKEKGYSNLSIVLGRTGELEKDFASLGNIMVFRPTGYGSRKSLPPKIYDYFSLLLRRKKLKKFVKGANVIFSNTVANGRMLGTLRNSVPKIVYVHELKNVIKYFDKHRDSSMSLRLADIIVYPSSRVAQNLQEDFDVLPTQLMRLNYYFSIDLRHTSGEQKSGAARREFAQRHHIREDAFWVVGMGTVGGRKGTDLFIKVCAHVKALDSNIHFVWIGDTIGEWQNGELENEITTAGISNSISFVGKIPHKMENLLPFDLFLLTSREDPYPLVVIEAAYNKVPTLCFSGSGGIVEFVKDGCGFMVDNFSTEEMAKKIIELKRSERDIKFAGEKAFKRAFEIHSNKELIERQFSDILQRVSKK